MGQYFTPVIVNAAAQVVAALDPSEYGSGLKLFGHTRYDTNLMRAVELLLAADGGARLVWAGDYAEDDPDTGTNLYFAAQPRHFVRFAGLVEDRDTATTAVPGGALSGTRWGTGPAMRFVVNADRREYLDNHQLPADSDGYRRTPLPTLTCEGSGAPYSDFTMGRWARQRIYLTATPPAADYRLLTSGLLSWA